MQCIKYAKMLTLFHNRTYHLKNKRNSATYTDGFTEAQLQILWGERDMTMINKGIHDKRVVFGYQDVAILLQK